MSRDDSTGLETHPFFELEPDARPRLPFPQFFQPGMGTELVGPFLYSIIRMVRPTRLMEVGIGYTSVWLLRALDDNKNVFIDWNANHEYFQKEYHPKLICLDDQSDLGPKSAEAIKLVEQHGSAEIWKTNFRGKADEISRRHGLFDFVWFDCGGIEEYRDFCEEYLSICSGFLLFHFTHSSGRPNELHQTIVEYTDRDPHITSLGDWSRIDFIEPHKHSQGSVMLLKRNAP